MDVNKKNESNEQPYKGKERRSASRLAVDANCILLLEDSHEVPVKIENLSFAGAFAAFDHDDRDFFINQRVWLKFTLKINKEIHKIEISGIIIRANNFGVGIAFRTSEREAVEPVMEKLTEYIQSNRAKKFDLE